MPSSSCGRSIFRSFAASGSLSSGASTKPKLKFQGPSFCLCERQDQDKLILLRRYQKNDGHDGRLAQKARQWRPTAAASRIRPLPLVWSRNEDDSAHRPSAMQRLACFFFRRIRCSAPPSTDSTPRSYDAFRSRERPAASQSGVRVRVCWSAARWAAS